MTLGWRPLLLTVVVGSALASHATAQSAPTPSWILHARYERQVLNGDVMEVFFDDGLVLARAGLELHAERGVALLDRDDLPRPEPGQQGLPRREATPPDPRRLVSALQLRARLHALLRSARGTPGPRLQAASFPLGVVQSIYLEGGVLVIENGQEIARADRIHFSTIDDRLVLFDGELRFLTNTDQGPRTLILRSAQLVRQGRRTTGRDVRVTTCNAGEPHVEVVVAEVEVIERTNDFEVRTRGNALALSGTRVLPLPNARFSTRDPSTLPIRGASAGLSGKDGPRAQLDVGGSLDGVGGPLHRFLTGRDADEFYGDWTVGLGYNQRRGFPVDTELRYGAPGRYRGRLEALGLDDHGVNRREIRNFFDGQPITRDGRALVRTENRFELTPSTTLDVSLFDASDPAVLPEFYGRAYRQDERPESSVYLRHAVDNRLLSATVRGNLAGFSYDSSRALAPAFVEELPRVDFDWFSEPIATLPGGTPLVITSLANAGYLRHDFDDTVPQPDDGTLRLDEELELAAPLRLGWLGLRPFATARATYFDETVRGKTRTRGAFAAGARAGTRLTRAWHWADGLGASHALQHSLSPQVVYFDRFHASGDPLDYRQFDDVDSLDERSEVRFEVLQRLNHRGSEGAEIHELVWLDLAQVLTPISGRDNAGHHLGLFEYELILRPERSWTPIPGLRFLLEGEHDWHEQRARTFNTGVAFGQVLGTHWRAEYRADQRTNGAIGYGASTALLQRWQVHAGSQYDLELSQTLNYVTQLVRQDHDWRIHFGVIFDAIDEDTRFFVNFEPLLGGLVRNRSYYGGGNTLYSGTAWDR